MSTEALGTGFLTLYPCGGPRPGTSSVNFAPGGETTNLVTVPVGDDGRVCVYSHAPTHVVIDLFGSFGAAGLLRDLSFGPLLLSPTFDGGVHDYAVRCSAGTNNFDISAKGMPGTIVRVDGQGSAPDDLHRRRRDPERGDRRHRRLRPVLDPLPPARLPSAHGRAAAGPGARLVPHHLDVLLRRTS